MSVVADGDSVAGTPQVPRHLYADAPRTAAGADVIAALQLLSERVREADERALRMLHLRALDALALLHIVHASRNGQLISPSVLARLMRLSGAAVTKLLDRLTEAGWVERRSNPGDRRGMMIAPSGTAERDVAMAYGHIHAPLVAVIDELADEELAAVARFARRLSSALEEQHVEGHGD